MSEKMITVRGCSHCSVRAACLSEYRGLCNIKQLMERARDEGERPRSTANGRWKGEA